MPSDEVQGHHEQGSTILPLSKFTPTKQIGIANQLDILGVRVPGKNPRRDADVTNSLRSPRESHPQPPVVEEPAQNRRITVSLGSVYIQHLQKPEIAPMRLAAQTRAGVSAEEALKGL